MVLRVVVLVALGAFAAPRAHAQAAEDLVRRHAELERELARAPSAQRERRLVALLDRAIDYDMIVSRVLVLHWEARSEAERAEATDLLTRAIRHRYRNSVEALRGWDVQVVSERERGIGRQVITRATRGAEVREIAYDLYLRERAWRVVDLIFDGDSLVNQYRTQFGALIRREGWDGFITRLRRRVEADGT